RRRTSANAREHARAAEAAWSLQASLRQGLNAARHRDADAAAAQRRAGDHATAGRERETHPGLRAAQLGLRVGYRREAEYTIKHEARAGVRAVGHSPGAGHGGDTARAACQRWHGLDPHAQALPE